MLYHHMQKAAAEPEEPAEPPRKQRGPSDVFKERMKNAEKESKKRQKR